MLDGNECTAPMCLFKKKTFRKEKSAELPLKPQQPKQPVEKNKKHRENQKDKKKKPKKPRVSGKGFGGHFSQIPCFFLFFLFLIFLNSFFSVFCFLIFQTISQKRFFRSASMWIVHSRFCADCPFSTKLCARCPTACLSYFFQSKQLFYIPTTWQELA